jgi:hypothetical protein
MVEQEEVSPRKTRGPSERLTRGMTAEEKDKFSRSYGRAKTVLKRINDYVSKELAQQGIAGDSPKAFEVPNWPYLQAWYAGYRHAMRVTQALTRTD